MFHSTLHSIPRFTCYHKFWLIVGALIYQSINVGIVIKSMACLYTIFATAIPTYF